MVDPTPLTVQGPDPGPRVRLDPDHLARRFLHALGVHAAGLHRLHPLDRQPGARGAPRTGQDRHGGSDSDQAEGHVDWEAGQGDGYPLLAHKRPGSREWRCRL